MRVITVAGLAMAAFLAGYSAATAVLDVARFDAGRIAGWGPDRITGFYTLYAILRGDWSTLGDAAPCPTRADGAAGDGHDRPLAEAL